MNASGATGDAVGSVQDDAFQGHGHNARVPGSGGSPLWVTQQVTNWDGVTKGDAVIEPVDLPGYGTKRISPESRSINAAVNYIIKE